MAAKQHGTRGSEYKQQYDYASMRNQKSHQMVFSFKCIFSFGHDFLF